MLTRGHIIGYAIDNLSELSAQLELRASLGLTDLNIYIENFYRDILNIVLDIHLVNLNSERSNAPGLDLAENGGYAFQITSDPSLAKIKKTAEKIGADAANKYKQIIVFIAGRRQDSYSLTKIPAGHHKFKDADIWDVNVICRKILEMKIAKLYELNEELNKNMAKVKIELEIPRANGSYKTSILALVEHRKAPSVSGTTNFYNYVQTQDGIPQTEVNEAITFFADQLSYLPRITREVLCFLLENREENLHGRGSYIFMYYSRAIRMLKAYPDYASDLELLKERAFIFFDDEESHDEVPKICLSAPSIAKYKSLRIHLYDFLKVGNINPRKVIVNQDFSDF